MNLPATTPETARRFSLRPSLYIAILLVALFGAFGYKLRFDGVFACPAADAGDTFLADCNSSNYGDYDHGAFWLDLEPDTRRAAHEAEVLFLGSSRFQFGLSSPATVSWFSSPPISFYLLGFSHTENVAFIAPLLDRIRPLAKVYVINVDRFFSEAETAPAAELLREPDSRAHYAEKRFWQRLQEPVCRALPALCGNKLAFFRRRDNGVWHLKGSAPFESSMVGDGPPTDIDRWAQFTSIAKRFVERLPVDPECVILTIVPYDGTKRAEAREIAKALGLNLVEPDVSGLTTFDGSHLDSPSAERWSTAFFALAGDQIRRCVADDQPMPFVAPGSQ